MATSARFPTLLFWSMTVVGALVLAPCLLLPAWLEYYAQHQLLQQREQRNARLQTELDALNRQITYMRYDPDYVTRVARAEAGLTPPTGQVRRIEQQPDDEAAAAPKTPTTPGSPAVIPIADEVTAFIDQTCERYPLVRLFQQRETRPVLMAMGGALILSALVLLGFQQPRQETTA